MTLTELGWTAALETAFAPHRAAGLRPARVVCELRRKFYAVQTADQEYLGECRPGFFHEAKTAEQFPAVGDWVAVSPRPDGTRADIEAVLPRRTKFSRRAAGSEEIEQIIATNIDTIFLVSGLDRNFNPQRIQRFLVASRESGAQPVILLNKSDLVDDGETVRKEVVAIAPDVPVLLTSSETRKGFKALIKDYIQPGKTVAFIGSSGVGKSSLINALLRDDALPTAEVREKDSKGRHTTTRRELVPTSTGALLIDTPGMRELQFWCVEGQIEDVFPDIAAWAAQCRFGNCSHLVEKDCAVVRALEAGELSFGRFESYIKLRAEKAKSTPARKKPSALASKPGWRRSVDADKPFRHRQYSED